MSNKIKEIKEYLTSVKFKKDLVKLGFKFVVSLLYALPVVTICALLNCSDIMIGFLGGVYLQIGYYTATTFIKQLHENRTATLFGVTCKLK